MFVVVDEWGAKRSAVTQGIRRYFFVESVFELSLNASVKTLNVFQAIQRELYLEDQDFVEPGSGESICQGVEAIVRDVVVNGLCESQKSVR